LDAIGEKSRLLATEQDKQAILIAIAQLEDRNPTPRPVEAGDLLDGTGDCSTLRARAEH